MFFSFNVENSRKKQTVHRINTTNSLKACLYNEYQVVKEPQCRRKERRSLYYEIYIDSLFLLNFTMNLYLFLLVNASLDRPATRRRLICGAAFAGAGYCLIFFLPFPYAVIKILVAAAAVNSIILCWTFRLRSFRAFLKILEKMALYAFLMGGIFWLLANHVRFFRTRMLTVTGITACGGILWLILSYGMEVRKKKANLPCKTVLFGRNGNRITVNAIVDTGNCLMEPISGKPVSVLDQEIFMQLFGEEPEGFRAIPYHSVGCDRGIMKGYEVPEIIIEQDGIARSCRNVYVGVSEIPLSAGADYRMLLHPALFKE